jgi:hypothetical protein
MQYEGVFSKNQNGEKFIALFIGIKIGPKLTMANFLYFFY